MQKSVARCEHRDSNDKLHGTVYTPRAYLAFLVRYAEGCTVSNHLELGVHMRFLTFGTLVALHCALGAFPTHIYTEFKHAR